MPDLSNIFLITDMDGTLLPENKILSDKSAIKQFIKDGGKFTIATGRTLQSAEKYIKELEIELPVILYNGSLIYDTHTDDVMFTDQLPDCSKEIAAELFKFMENPGGEVLRLDNIYVKKSIQEFVRLNRLMQLLTAYLRAVGLRFFLLQSLLRLQSLENM